MPRQKRESHKTPLAQFLRRVLKEHDVSILQASRIAGCAPSVLHGWLQGSYPAETIDKLKRLANHYGYSLAVAMSGEPDEIRDTFDLRQHYRESVVFDGLAQIQIKKLERIKVGGEK